MGKPSYKLPQIVEQLDSGHHWEDPVVTYSFPGWDDISGFSAFSFDQQQMAEQVLDLWSDVANITFKVSYLADDADIRFMNVSELPAWIAGATGDYPGDDPEDGDVYINPTHKNNSFESGALFTLLHEVGHALGLSHPGDYNSDAEDPANVPTYEKDAVYLQDSQQYTVMSYFSASYTGADHGSELPATPLLHDIYAIQAIYGTNLKTREGDTVYGYNSTAGRDAFDFTLNSSPVIAIWDGGGIDTLDLSGSLTAVRLDLEAGAFSDVGGLTNNVAIAYKTYIENAIGGEDDDVIVGNGFENNLRGGEGNDQLYGEQPNFWLGYAWNVGNTPSWVLDENDELYGEDGRDTLRGGWGDDLLHGGADADDLNGGAGDDELNGGAGRDMLVGDAGTDEIHGGSGDDEIWGHRHEDTPVDKLNDPNWAYEETDYLYGGDGGDTIHGGYGDDWIYGDGGQDDNGELVHGAVYSGDDYLYGEQGSDFIEGGEGRDFIDGGDGVDYLYGQNGNDTLQGQEGNDHLWGGSGHDWVTGQEGEDTLRGEGGNDWLSGGSERDTFYGGAGTDTLSYFGETDRWEVDLVSGFAINLDANYDELLSSIENLELGHGDDIAYGTDGANVIRGFWGNDTIRGRNGNDTLHGDDGIDGLYGGGGNDMLDPDAYGGLGLDGDYVDGDNDVVDGGAGIDTVSYAGATETVTVDLAGDWATGDDIGFDLIVNVENAFGGLGDDYLYGDGAANQLLGGYGHDVLQGRGGNDHLLGGAGNDILRPGAGNDTVDGGDGIDTLSYSDSGLSWLVDLSGGYASSGLGSYQTLIGIEDIALGTGSDVAYGTSGDNAIGGNDGNDYLHGGDGGNDRLYGGDGDDTLHGGSGEDWLEGGDGDDVFSFDDESQLATISDFTDGSDLISVDMTLYQSFNDLAIEADADGNAVIYMGPRQITLLGVSVASVDNSDFIWL
jgi:Ca2+-binding RTX toxin-like protein